LVVYGGIRKLFIFENGSMKGWKVIFLEPIGLFNCAILTAPTGGFETLPYT
jgi:hypothetical protein